ncbi:MAG: HupE/UreJ family protein [Verrucomicrobia bacterium]|jgi:hydrogenase/urease accessory protein HupE|nr:HupE/UreJ family protein [Verrucomicrobiota bacterium]
MPRTTPLLRVALFGFFTLFSGLLWAHSIPDVPVRGIFQTGGETEITIEINPRNWSESPKMAPSLEQKEFLTYTKAQREELLKQTRAWVATYLEFTLEPIGRIQPDFTYDFIAETGKPLLSMTDAVVARGRWKTKIPAGVTGWKVRSLPGHKVAVVFMNTINGQEHPRVPVLFPGESSFTLDLTGLAAAQPTQPTAGSISAQHDEHGGWNTFVDFLRYGFTHVLPEGLDHILFVLGLFLLSRSWKPVLTQVTAFTLAHSLTLGLAAAGMIKVPASIVEPIIALSIAAIAIENIFHPEYTRWRLVIVLIFGSIHGLGFASGLAEKPIPQDSFLLALTGFNVGVEAAQLAVIGLAFTFTFWIKDETKYRRFVVIPASALIALAGLIWAYQRLA